MKPDTEEEEALDQFEFTCHLSLSLIFLTCKMGMALDED